MVNCSVVGCKNRSERNYPNITFHRFPREQIYRNKWAKCTGRGNWCPSQHSRICSEHFESNCFRPSKNDTYMYIKPRSVPTLLTNIKLESDKDEPDKEEPQDTFKCETLAPHQNKHESDVDELDEDEPNTSECEASVFKQLCNPLRNYTFLPSIPPENGIETQSTSSQETVSAMEEELTQQKEVLLRKLKKKTIMCEKRKKQIAVLRSKTWRLEKKTAKLNSVIKELKMRSLIELNSCHNSRRIS